MSRNGCPQVWEVEAARDGRLQGGALAKHLAHRAICVECTENADSLDRLARELRAQLSIPPNDLVLRRLRPRVLAMVDARNAGRGRRGWWSRPASLIVAALLVVLVTGAALAAWRERGSARPALPVATGNVAVLPSAPEPPAEPVVEEATPLPPASARAHPPGPAPSAPSAPDRSADAEDRAYLRVVALLRDGREREGRSAARAYLRDYPAGFRRDEMQRIADADAP